MKASDLAQGALIVVGFLAFVCGFNPVLMLAVATVAAVIALAVSLTWLACAVLKWAVRSVFARPAGAPMPDPDGFAQLPPRLPPDDGEFRTHLFDNTEE